MVRSKQPRNSREFGLGALVRCVCDVMSFYVPDLPQLTVIIGLGSTYQPVLGHSGLELNDSSPLQSY